MPTSKDPEKRARQLANLRRGGGPPKGSANGLVHGQRTEHPHNSVEWDPAIALAVEDLQRAVHASLRDADGQLHPWARPSVETVAIQRVASARMARYIADREARGKLTPRDLDLQSTVGERYHKALEREALTLRSQIETMRASLDIATALAHAREEKDPVIRRAILKAAGLPIEDGPGVSIEDA